MCDMTPRNGNILTTTMRTHAHKPIFTQRHERKINPTYPKYKRHNNQHMHSTKALSLDHLMALRGRAIRTVEGYDAVFLGEGG